MVHVHCGNTCWIPGISVLGYVDEVGVVSVVGLLVNIGGILFIFKWWVIRSLLS